MTIRFKEMRAGHAEDLAERGAALVNSDQEINMSVSNVSIPQTVTACPVPCSLNLGHAYEEADPGVLSRFHTVHYPGGEALGLTIRTETMETLYSDGTTELGGAEVVAVDEDGDYLFAASDPGELLALLGAIGEAARVANAANFAAKTARFEELQAMVYAAEPLDGAA